MKRRKNNKYLLLLALLLLVTVGYALISTTLKITGNATVTKQTWSVYWGVPTVTEGSVSTTAPTRGADSGDPANTKLTWSATLSLPGDFYEFTVDAVNAGTIDAMITGITPTVSPALPTNPDYIKYSVTYDDGVEPALNHLLPKADQSTTPSTPTTEKYKVRVYYDEAAATAATINNMSSSTTYTFTLNITYGQADENATPTHPTWTLPEGRTKDNLQVGDEICLKEDSTQCFNFIRYDNDDIVMLAKYNLKVGNINSSSGTKTGEYTSSDEGYGLQSSEARGYVAGASTYNGTVAFSSTNYWYDGSALKPEYGTSYPADIYDEVNYKGNPDAQNYSVAYYVDKYKTLLTNKGATIKKARLLTYSEATDSSIGCDKSTLTCPTDGFITNTTFWLGSARMHYDVWRAYSGGNFYNGLDIGVRPVVVVEKSNL